jgi:hypothetical protein
MHVFMILKWSPDNIPIIQVSGLTVIFISHFVCQHGANWSHKRRTFL